ncbi:MAG: hypothetical protein WAL50_05715 [Kineosporiaceae bacterium]
MRYLFLTAAVLYLAILTVGVLTGRLRLKNGCCAPADPGKDLRMRDAAAPPAPSTHSGQSSGRTPEHLPED